MNLKLSVLISASLACGMVAASAQSPDTSAKTNVTNEETLELLRRVIAQQQQNPDKIVRVPASTNAVPGTPTKADLERQYLAGQLTAKQYQKALGLLEKEEQKRAAEAEKQRKREAQQAAKAAPAPARKPAESKAPTTVKTPAPPVVVMTNPPAAQTLEQKKISEVESRLDEMLRKKAERDKAALNNAAAPTNNPAQTPQTKRQRMDALLKQMIDGKISEADYTAQRSKLLVEPD